MQRCEKIEKRGKIKFSSPNLNCTESSADRCFGTTKRNMLTRRDIVFARVIFRRCFIRNQFRVTRSSIVN